MVIMGSDRYTHILIIGGPPFSFLGLLQYRLKSDVRVRDLKFTLSGSIKRDCVGYRIHLQILAPSFHDDSLLRNGSSYPGYGVGRR
jgi:hypothetical protein